MIPNFSPIQNHIISKLKNARLLRYSELHPEKTPNDLFNYHLQFLVKKGYVRRTDDGYSLSPAGIKHVADFNPPSESSGSFNLFKVNVLTIVSRIHGEKMEILQQVRKSNPSYGKIGVMGGIVRKGESMENAATRKLRAETGLDAIFEIVGMQRRIMYVKGELFSDILFPIAYSNSFIGNLIEDTEYGHNMWTEIDQAIKNESVEFDSIKKLPDVFRAIADGSIKNLPFFYEEDIQSGDLI